MAREKKKILCPAGCGWSKTNWGDLRKHLAMSKDALHSNWRKKWALPEQPVPLGGKGHKEYFRDVKIALFLALADKNK